MSNSLTAGWCKEDSKRHRRVIVSKRCHGNNFIAGQTMLDLHNRSRDTEVRKLARADALHFFNLCKRNGKHAN